jgi:hypothetical protein
MLRNLFVFPFRASAHSLPLSLALLAINVQAEQSAHLHGLAQLDIAVDGKAIELNLHITASDVFGFEHAPKTAEQKRKVADGKALVTRASNWLELPVGCKAQPVGIVTWLPGAKVAEHDNHDHDHKNEHDHHDHGKDDHAQHEHADVHADLELALQLKCSTPPKALSIKLLKSLPALSTLKVQWLNGNQQGGTELISGGNAVVQLGK